MTRRAQEKCERTTLFVVVIAAVTDLSKLVTPSLKIIDVREIIAKERSHQLTLQKPLSFPQIVTPDKLTASCSGS